LFLALKPEEEHLFKKYRIRNEIVVHDRGVPTKVKGRFFWFMDTNGRCPYLDTQGACSIYEDRPSACRTFPTEPVPGCLVWPPEWTRQMVPLPTPGLNDELPIGKLNT
jgi:Fe-S-cluster containining protein